METKNVFIVGCGRTGTKLLRQILNLSDRVSITTETHYLLHRLGGVGPHGKQIKQIGPLSDDSNLEKYLDYIYADHIVAPFWQWLKRNVEQQEFKYRLLETDRTERAIFALLMRIYAEKTKDVVRDDIILGEKTPSHLYHVPTLFEWFPQAKIIHTFRDPRAITSSRAKKFTKRQAGGLRKKSPFLPTWLLDMSDTPIAASRTSKSWFDAVRLHAQYEKLYSNRYRLLRFEDLIIQPEENIKQICDFLSIPFDDKMLQEVIVIGSSYQSQQRGSSGFDIHVLERWKEHLNPLVKAWFLIRARKQLKQFGYVP